MFQQFSVQINMSELQDSVLVYDEFLIQFPALGFIVVSVVFRYALVFLMNEESSVHHSECCKTIYDGENSQASELNDDIADSCSHTAHPDEASYREC